MSVTSFAASAARHLRDRELMAISRLAVGKVAALAELARLHGPGNLDLARWERAVAYTATTQEIFLPLKRVRGAIAKLYPSVPLIIRDSSPEAWLPHAAIIRLLHDTRHSKPRLEIGSFGDFVEVRLTLTARWRPELDDTIATLWPGLADAGVLVEVRSGNSGAIRIITPQSVIRRRIDAALEAAANTINIHPSRFVKNDNWPMTYVHAGAGCFYKLRLAFLYGSVFDEWVALRTLRHHPSLVRAWSYQARPDWDLIAEELIIGRTLGEVARALDPGEPTAARHLLRLLDVVKFIEMSGIEHRDLREYNVLVDHNDQLRVIDLGSAVAIHPWDGVPEVSMKTRALLSFHFSDLINTLRWEQALTYLINELKAAWRHISSPRFSLDIPRGRLPGTTPFWPRWHALAGAVSSRRGSRVAVVGDDTGLFAVMALLHGAGAVSLVGGVATQLAARRIGGHTGIGDRLIVCDPSDIGGIQPDVLIVVGSLQREERGVAASLVPRAAVLLAEINDPPERAVERLEREGWANVRALPARGFLMVEATRQ